MTLVTGKTYKREISILSLIFLNIFIGYVLFTAAKVGAIEQMVTIVTVQIIPVYALVAAAFGIDAYFKQNPKTGELQEITTTTTITEQERTITPPPVITTTVVTEEPALEEENKGSTVQTT